MFWMLVSLDFFRNLLCLKKWIFKRSLLISFLLSHLSLEALPTVVQDPIPCVLDLERNFFVEHIVNQGLSLYNVRQELWVPINQLLQRKSLEVPQRLKARTAYMVPNPIEYPMQRGVVAKILKEIFFEVFLEVMREYKTNERPRADFIFDYIFIEQLPRFIQCFGEEAKALQPKNLL